MTIQEEIQNGESRTLEYKATLPHDSQNFTLVCWLILILFLTM